jgi:hypothetical protein
MQSAQFASSTWHDNFGLVDTREIIHHRFVDVSKEQKRLLLLTIGVA